MGAEEGTGIGGRAHGALEPDAGEPSERYEAFRLEQRGIELIPEAERPMRPAGLFWMWAGAIWNVEYLVYGALVVSFGLSFMQAVVAILVGNLAYAFLGLTSLPGPETGTTAFMVSRAPFGRNGNRVPSLLNWVTQVGFEVEGIVLVVLIVEAMFSHEGTVLGTGAKVVVIIAAVAVQFVVPFLGHATITKVLRYLSFLFIAVFAAMAVLVIPHAHPSHLHQHSSWWIWTTGLVLIVSGGGLSWTENAADYSRYLPRETSKVKTFWAASLGAAVPSVLLELLGAVAYLVSPKVTVATGVPSSFASWFFWPFLVLALPQLFCINTLDMYSSGVTLQAIGVRLKRWGCIIVDTVICGGITALVIFKGNFYRDLSGFVDYIVVWLGPWFGILLVDYLLPRWPLRLVFIGRQKRRYLLAGRGVQLESPDVTWARHVRCDDVGRRGLLLPVVHVPVVQPHPWCRFQLVVRDDRGRPGLLPSVRSQGQGGSNVGGCGACRRGAFVPGAASVWQYLGAWTIWSSVTCLLSKWTVSRPSLTARPWTWPSRPALSGRSGTSLRTSARCTAGPSTSSVPGRKSVSRRPRWAWASRALRRPGGARWWPGAPGHFEVGEPEEPMWAWGADRHVRFWSRRQLHETLVHRMDAELALGRAPAAAASVAADAVDEFLANLPRAVYFSPKVANLRGDDVRLEFRATDEDRAWWVTLRAEGFDVATATSSPQEVSAQATLTGPAETLLLVLYRRLRVGTTGVAVSGDTSLVDFWLANSALE